MNQEFYYNLAYFIPAALAGIFMLAKCSKAGAEEVHKVLASFENAYFGGGLAIFIAALFISDPVTQTCVILIAVALLAFTFHNFLTRTLLEKLSYTVDYRIFTAFLAFQAGLVIALEKIRGAY